MERTKAAKKEDEPTIPLRSPTVFLRSTFARVFIVVVRTSLPNITKKRETRAPRSHRKSRGELESSRRASRQPARLNVNASGWLTSALLACSLAVSLARSMSPLLLSRYGRGPTETSTRVGESRVRLSSGLGKFYPWYLSTTFHPSLSQT